MTLPTRSHPQRPGPSRIRAWVPAIVVGPLIVAFLFTVLGAPVATQALETAQRLARAPNANATATSPIPPRPEHLRFDDTPFPSPDASRYRHQLSNGVVVYVVEDRAAPLVDVSVALPVGEVLDPPDRLGTASLTAAMLRRGGAGARDASAFDEEADFLAASIDSVGGSRRSGLSLDVSSRVLEPALDLLADVLLRPRFQADRLAVLCDNLRASLRTRNDDPLDVLDRRWRMLLYGAEHPLARQLAPRHLEGLDPDALRDFHARHWRPRGAAIAVSGDVDAATAVRLLEKRLGAASWPAEDPQRNAANASPASPPPAPRKPSLPGVYWVEHGTPQAKLMLGHEGLQRKSWDDPDAWAAMVMSEVLDGSGTVSRLRSRLRSEAALVYRVRTSFGIGAGEAGLFEVFLEVAPEAAGSALGIVVAEIERLRREPVSDVELQLARRSLVDAFPLLFDGAEQLAGRLAEDALLGRPHDYWHNYRRRLAAVTAADVQRVARLYLRPRELRVLWVGPEPPAGAFAAVPAAGEPVRLPLSPPGAVGAAGDPVRSCHPHAP